MKVSLTKTMTGLLVNLLLTICCIPALAQNSSYNANTIPIGGTRSAAFGFEALLFNTGGSNTAQGYKSLRANTTGGGNTAIGATALISNTTGELNTAAGLESLFANTTGAYNTATGSRALSGNTTGNENTATGHSALYLNGTGYQNTATGSLALFSNTTGYNNIAHGAISLYSNTAGFNNIATGYHSLYFNTTGSGNSAYGHKALYSNVSGKNNTAVGDSAGYKSTGNKNVFLGNFAGYYETSGSQKLYLASDSNKTILYGDFSTGQVLMGKGQPAGYTFKGARTLNVIGGVLTDSVRVMPVSAWADYVFEEGYPLPTLEELERYVKINKRLPGIPSAREVKEEGIELGLMNARLLEKIEELYLYILQQKENIHKQSEIIEEMRKEFRELKKSR